eukprot:TRINITY_DN2028_c1_g1_i3.p1 TRINITY_DN2028_c1_g1~~TRINITY_DN2028_c1_g1_i3.p1  ORF type:complete len:175 (-),score=25.19 TRINITY_DN2028_c1_g1_i3:52-576(-)
MSMKNQSHCTRWFFKDGITNGAEWYPLVGGMQDFNYLFSNGMEITLEVSCCKYPKSYFVNNLWDQNYESMIKYLEQVHQGVKGLVFDSSGFPVQNAKIMVENLVTGNKYKTVVTSEFGEYWKLLLPGTYRMKAEVPGCLKGGTYKSSSWQKFELRENAPLLEFDMTLEESACPR